MRPLLALTLLLLLLAAPAQASLVVGWNQAWIGNHYGSDLTSRFDEAAWRTAFARTRDGGGRLLRVWLFEGETKEGIVYDGTRPTGVDPRLLANLDRVVALAREHRVRVLWCAFDGNWFWARGTLAHFRHYNLLQDKYGEGTAFRERVLGPVVDRLAAAGDVTWGLDVMNELQGSVRSWMWSDGWAGARRFVAATARFVKARAPGLRVGASSGHHSGAEDILDGRYDGLGLDFVDLHVYDDRGRIPDGAEVVAHCRARGMVPILGEFGQKREADDPALQARVTERFLAEAERLGFAAALAWRLEDPSDGGRRYSFFAPGGAPRPAYEVMRRFAAARAAPPATTSAPAGPTTATPGLAGALGR